MMRKILSLAAMLACCGAAPMPQTHGCDVHGWGSAPVMQVRAAPSPGARLLGVLRQRAADEGGQEITGTFPEFRITGAQGGWFRITGADYGDYGDPAPRRAWYRGAGWVRGDQIGGQVLAGRLHAAPAETSRSRRYGKDADAVTIRRLLDCRGFWVKVEADIGTGWVHDMCSNQVTTCN